MQGLGISVLSLHAVKRELDQGIIVEIPIQGWRIVRQVYLIYRHQLGIMKHHQLFLDYVRESSGFGSGQQTRWPVRMTGKRCNAMSRCKRHMHSHASARITFRSRTQTSKALSESVSGIRIENV